MHGIFPNNSTPRLVLSLALINHCSFLKRWETASCSSCIHTITDYKQKAKTWYVLTVYSWPKTTSFFLLFVWALQCVGKNLRQVTVISVIQRIQIRKRGLTRPSCWMPSVFCLPWSLCRRLLSEHVILVILLYCTSTQMHKRPAGKKRGLHLSQRDKWMPNHCFPVSFSIWFLNWKISTARRFHREQSRHLWESRAKMNLWLLGIVRLIILYWLPCCLPNNTDVETRERTNILFLFYSGHYLGYGDQPQSSSSE